MGLYDDVVDAIDRFNANVTAQMTTLNSGMGDLKDSVDGMSTQLTTGIGTIETQLVKVVSAVDEIETKLDNLTTAVGGINTTLTDKLDAVITQLTQLGESFNTFIEAFGNMATQGLTNNVQDIRDDTREGLGMSKEALRRSGLSSRISAPGAR